MAHPKYNGDPELLKLKIKDHDIEELIFETEKHDYENFSKSLKIENEYYKKKYRSSNKRKKTLNTSDILLGSSLTVVSSLISIFNPIFGVLMASVSASVTSIAILIRNENFSEIETQYAELGGSRSVDSLLYGMALKQSMIDEKVAEKSY